MGHIPKWQLPDLDMAEFGHFLKWQNSEERIKLPKQILKEKGPPGIDTKT